VVAFPQVEKTQGGPAETRLSKNNYQLSGRLNLRRPPSGLDVYS
jgi:hypothetical protein